MAAAAANDALASDWKRFTAKQRGLKTVSQYCPEQPYVELCIPLELRVIRRVIFKITSHDQGFSDDARNHGTYEASHTWFEVAAITPSGHDRTPRRHLQSNLHGDVNFREHAICWEHDNPSVAIRNWLCALRPCDTIQIIPKARYVAWRNFIQAAEIEILGESSHEHSLSRSLPSSVGAVDAPTEQAQSFGFYRPLDESRQEIRVIKIHPRLGDDDMVVTIESISLRDTQRAPYEGLSYCWGDPMNTKTLKVIYSSTENVNMQQCFVSVNANLYEALNYIRCDDHARVFWIDAICINQTDVHERSQQVSMMRQIYSGATGVVVWLGKSNPEVQKSIKDARHVMRRYQDATEISAPQHTTSELHHPLFEHGFYHLDSQFFLCDWFRRTWVLQEVFNAKSVSVYCGHNVLPWSLVLRLNECLNRSMLVPNPIRKNVMSSLLAGLFELKEDMNNESHFTYNTRQNRFGILDVLIRGLDLDATDPKDKLFALLCFGDETVNVSQLPPAISPDYSKSVGRVFADFTRWWISTHQSLRILSSVHASIGRTWQRLSPHRFQEDSDRASWSMWHNGKAIWALGTLGLLPRTPPYCASGSTFPDISLLDSSPSPMVLRLRGGVVTTIATLAPYPYYVDNTARNALHTAYSELFDPVNTRGTWKSGILQTELLELQRPDNQTELMDKLVDHFHAHFDYSSRTGAIECHHEALFTTPEGSMGLCPAQARIGDKIVVLDGGNVPYLLRARDRKGAELESELQYEFVGECYLDGYMYGRSIQERNRPDGPPTQIFNLV